MTSIERQVDSSIREDPGPGVSEGVSPLTEAREAIAVQIAAELQASLEELTEGWYRRMEAIPQLVSWLRPDVRDMVLPQARVDIGRELAGLLDGRKLPTTCPAEVIQSARLAAAGGLPLWAALQSYRAGHAQQWQAWSDAVERRHLEPADRRALLSAGSEYFFAYADRCIRWLELEYTRAREIPLRREEQRRIQLVGRLLDGQGGDGAELGYDLSQWHVGLIATGSDTERLVSRLAERAGVSLLAVAFEATTAWLWIGMTAAPTEIQRRLAALTAAPGASLAIGEPAPGKRGFRLTHGQAQTAAAIGARLGRAITLYADVAVEDLMGRDREQAEAFISRELGALAAPTREAGILRETLSAYFGCAQRASSAAIQLGVHERTIGNRLRRSDRLTGRSASAGRVELEIALRLHALLSDGART